VHTRWARNSFVDSHLTAISGYHYAYHWRYGEVINQTVFYSNTTITSNPPSGSNINFTPKERGILGEWQTFGNNLTGLLYNTSQILSEQSEAHLFINPNDATLICAGTGCNGPVLTYDMLTGYDFRFTTGTNLLDNPSRIGFLDSEWEKFVAIKLFTLGILENFVVLPSISITSPTNTTYPSGSDIPLNYTPVQNTNPIDTCSLQLDDTARSVLTSCANTSITGLADGSHNVTVFVNDTAGNEAYSGVVFFTLFTPAAPITGQVTGAGAIILSILVLLAGLGMVLFTANTVLKQGNMTEALVITIIGITVVVVIATFVASIT
jgi:hypothetical protein